MKSWLHLGLNDEEMRKFLECAQKEDIDLGTAIRWLANKGFDGFYGAEKKVSKPSLSGEGREKE